MHKSRETKERSSLCWTWDIFYLSFLFESALVSYLKSTAKSKIMKIYPFFCYNSFIILYFIFRSFTVQLHSFACRYPVISALFVEVPIPPPLNSLGMLVENQLATDYFWTLRSNPLVSITILCQHHKFWNWEVWILQFCCSFSIPFWLFRALVIPYEF